MKAAIGAIYHDGVLVEFDDYEAMDDYREGLDAIASARRDRAHTLREQRRERDAFLARFRSVVAALRHRRAA